MSMYGDVVSFDGELREVKEDVGWRRGGRFQVAQVNELPSMTKQEFAEESDINNILAQYKKTGLVAHVNRYQGDYMDVGDAVTYQEGLNIVMRAEQMFASLPSDVRGQFDNDPGAFLAFATDPANRQKLGEMGLLKEGWNVKEVERVVVAGESGKVDRGSDDRKSAKDSDKVGRKE